MGTITFVFAVTSARILAIHHILTVTTPAAMAAVLLIEHAIGIAVHPLDNP